MELSYRPGQVSTHMSTHMSAHMSTQMSTHMSIHISIHMSVHRQQETMLRTSSQQRWQQPRAFLSACTSMQVPQPESAAIVPITQQNSQCFIPRRHRPSVPLIVFGFCYVDDVFGCCHLDDWPAAMQPSESASRSSRLRTSL